MQEEAATLRAQAAMERKKCEQLRSEIQAQRSVSVRRWKPLDHNDCIQAYERCGPAKLAEMKKQTAIAKDAQLCKQEIFFWSAWVDHDGYHNGSVRLWYVLIMIMEMQMMIDDRW